MSSAAQLLKGPGAPPEEPAHLRKVRVKKTAEIVAGQIRNAVVRGELQAGETLPNEAQLIARFEVSRPTVREAIRILESEGLLQVSRGARGGARINGPSSELVTRSIGLTLQSQLATLGDVYQARMMIEPPAARLAAERRPKLAAEALRAHIAYERTVLDDRLRLAAAIGDFHRLVVAQSENKTMTLIADALNEISVKHLALVHRSHRRESVAVQARRTQQGFKSNDRLVELIESGDGPGAEAHWRQHMAKVASYWLEGVESSGLDVLD